MDMSSCFTVNLLMRLASYVWLRKLSMGLHQCTSKTNAKSLIYTTVIILNIGTDRSEQTVQTQIRLLLMEQSDQGLLCLLFCLHLLNTTLHCKIQLFQFRTIMVIISGVPIFRIFTVFQRMLIKADIALSYIGESLETKTSWKIKKSLF